MTRYFFPASQAHLAYAMAIEYGMEFSKRFGKWSNEGIVHIRLASGYKLYVHDDSKHILIPKDGDIGIDDNGELFRNDNGGWWVQARDGDPHRLPFGQPRIIQRGGKAFAMPEREEAMVTAT